MKKELLILSPKEFCRATQACADGAKFALGYKTMGEVWANCQRVDWMIWILNAIAAPPDEKACRLYMVWCARNTPLANGKTTESLLTDKRSLNALVVAERYANGAATATELAAAWDAAYAAANDAAYAAYAAANAAAHAAWAAANAADAVYAAANAAANAAWAAANAAWAAAYAAYAAYAAANAAAYAAANAANAAARSAQCDQLRKVVSNHFI